MTRANIIDLAVIIVDRTDKEVLVKDDEDGKEVWLPLSQVEVEGDPG